MTSFVTALRTSVAVILRVGSPVAISNLNNALFGNGGIALRCFLKAQVQSYDRSSLTATYHSLRNFSLWNDDVDSAGERYRLALELCREMGNRSATAGSLVALERLSVNLGKVEDALRYFQEVLQLFCELKHPTLVTLTVVQFMRIAFKADEKERATVLFGSADRLALSSVFRFLPESERGRGAVARVENGAKRGRFPKTLWAKESEESG